MITDVVCLPLAGSAMFFLSTETLSAGRRTPSIVSALSSFEEGEPVGEPSPEVVEKDSVPSCRALSGCRHTKNAATSVDSKVYNVTWPWLQTSYSHENKDILYMVVFTIFLHWDYPDGDPVHKQERDNYTGGFKQEGHKEDKEGHLHTHTHTHTQFDQEDVSHKVRT